LTEHFQSFYFNLKNYKSRLCLIFVHLQSHILHLPDEILELILAQADLLLVGEVCKRFYSVSCRMKAFKMKVDSSTIIEDVATFESIVNSSRKIESIAINRGHFVRKKFHSEEMKKILENFREHVKELEIRDHFMRLEGFQLLNMLSRIEKLNLHGISVGKMKVPQTFRLRLPNLRELEINESDVQILEVFDRLDDDILRKLTLGSIVTQSPQNKYLANQRNIVDLTTAKENDMELLDLQQLKLKKVSTKLRKPTLYKLLEGQDELVEMKLSYITTDHQAFYLNFSNITSLEILDVCGFGTIYLISLDELPNLKKLKMHQLTPIKSASLQELIVRYTSDNNLTQTVIGCPNLRVLDTGNQRIDGGPAFLYLPRLESLTCFALVISGTNIHHHLKHLRMEARQLDLLSIVNRCEVLESLSTIIYCTSIVKNVLLSKPGLKSLFLKYFNPSKLEIIKDFGGNLEVFQCTPYLNDFNLDVLKTELKDVFDEFEEQDGIYTAKKAGAVVNFEIDWRRPFYR
jgi:hypothetical protein